MIRIIAILAWRNLWRHRKRTLLTATTLALALTMLVVFLGLGDGGHQQMIENGVRMGAGHVVLQHPDYQTEGAFEQLIPGTLADRVRERLSDNAVVTERLIFSGLLSSASGATGGMIIGVDPTHEVRASLFAERVTDGQFFDPDLANGVVIGTGIARRLELEVGRKFVVMAQGGDNAEIQSKLLRVAGILNTGITDLDQSLVLMPLADARAFLGTGNQCHQIAILLPSDDQTAATVEQLRTTLPGTANGARDSVEPNNRARDSVEPSPDSRSAGIPARSPLPAPVAVLPWQEALPELRDYIRVDDAGNYLFHGVFFLIVGFMIMNTLLMSVLERRREFALLDALGLQPGYRSAMILFEGFFLSLLATTVGLLLAWPIHHYFATTGLPLEWFYSGDLDVAGVVVDPILYSRLSPTRIAQATAAVTLLTITLAVPPALRAARRESNNLLGADA